MKQIMQYGRIRGINVNRMTVGFDKSLGSSLLSSATIFPIDVVENDIVEGDDYVNSRFRFVVGSGIAIDDNRNIPWGSIEHVCYPTPELNYYCPICLEPPVAARNTRCAHIFCLPCIKQHLFQGLSSSRCPLCFAPISEPDLRSMEFTKTNIVHVGDVITMSLLCRIKAHVHPKSVDPTRSLTFNRFLRTDSIDDLAERELKELHDAASSCECPKKTSFIQNAILNVQEHHSQWKHGVYDDDGDTIGTKPVPPRSDMYYFYQCSDGSPVFLHSLNYRALVEEYGTDFPWTIHGQVLDIVQYVQSEEHRSRFRFLRHLPISTTFYIVELNIDDYLSIETKELFHEEARTHQVRRDYKRKQQELIEQRLLRKKEEQQFIESSHVEPLYKYDPYPVPQVESTECFPSLASTPSNRKKQTPQHRTSAWSTSMRWSTTLHPTKIDEEDDDMSDDQVMPASFTPPDWNIVDIQIVRKCSQKQRGKLKPTQLHLYS